MDINGLIAHLAENAPGFASRLTQANLTVQDLQTEQDLLRLPVIRKDDLAEIQAAAPPFGGFLACSPGDLKRIFQSPGPIYDPEPRQPDYWRWKSALMAAGFQPGDVALNAFGYHLTPAGAMFEEGLWALGCAVIPGGIGNQEQQVRALHDLKVTAYVGLPSYLKALLDKAQKLELKLYLKKAFVTAEPLPPSLRSEINAHGVIIRQGYGTAECGNLGYECEQQAGLHMPDDALVEVCDINTGWPLQPGQTGEVVVTLFTRDYALVRFGTGDLSAVNETPCKCGRKSLRLMGWQGRVGDAVKVRGMFLHPRQLHELMTRFPEATAWQARVLRKEHKDQLILQVVPQQGCDTEALSAQLIATAREVIKFRLTVEFVDSLPENAFPIEDTRTWE